MGLELTEAQKVVIESYCGGEYGFLVAAAGDYNDWDAFREHYQSVVADGLFDFLLIEASPSEGCDGIEEALRRIRRVVEDVQSVEGAMADAHEAKSGPPAPQA